MDAQLQVQKQEPGMLSVAEDVARAQVRGEKWAFSPRAVGRHFATMTGAEMSPIRDIAVGFILVGIALVIALTILPVITSAVNTAQTDGNISASDSTLLGLLPTLLIVGLLAGGVAFLFRGFRAVNP